MSSYFRINEFAKRIGRSVQTVRRWEAEGKLVAKRLPSGQRYFGKYKQAIQEDFPALRLPEPKEPVQ